MRSPLQLVLDFLTGGDPEVLPTPAAPAATPVREPMARTAPEPSPECTLDAHFAHAASNRQALLQGVTVAYRFERSRRRSIGFTVGPEGLVVRAPSWVALREVDAAVQEKAGWILAKLCLLYTSDAADD